MPRSCGRREQSRLTDPGEEGSSGTQSGSADRKPAEGGSGQVFATKLDHTVADQHPCTVKVCNTENINGPYVY